MTDTQWLALVAVVMQVVVIGWGYASLQRYGALTTPVRWLTYAWLVVAAWLALVVLTQ